MFEHWGYCWLRDGSGGNEFKCSSESNGEHVKTVEGKKGEKGRKDFHNRTIWFWNKYSSDIRVLTSSIIVTGFFSYIIIPLSSVIVIMVRTVFLGMSRLSLSTQWTDIKLAVPLGVR